MSLFDELKKRADVNGDGKITKEDLNALNSPENKAKIDELKKTADGNNDGKIDVNDLKNFNLSKVTKGIKNVFGG